VRPLVVLGFPTCRRGRVLLMRECKVLGVRKRAVAVGPACRTLAMPMRSVESGNPRAVRRQASRLAPMTTVLGVHRRVVAAAPARLAGTAMVRTVA